MRFPRPRRSTLAGRFRQPALLLAGVIVYGTGGYLLIERWNLLDSIYMTVITISTVGFTEVHRLSAGGRIFTISLIVGGVGTMLYALGILAEALAEGELGRFRRELRLERRLEQLQDHFIVCGYGRIGTQIVREFEEDDIPYVVVENNPEALSRLEREARLHVEGDAAAEEVLTQAGIARARCLISAVDSDERAVYVVLAARALRPDFYVVARAGRPESIRRLELAGADRVISPYRMAGHRMAELALRPAVVDVLDSLHHGDSEIGIEEAMVASGSPILGKTLDGSGLTAPDAARLLAVRRQGGDLFVNPDPDLRIEEGDLLIALGSRDQLQATNALLK